MEVGSPRSVGVYDGPTAVFRLRYLDGAVLIETVLDEVLTNAVGASLAGHSVLREVVIPSLNTDKKVKALAALIERLGLEGQFSHLPSRLRGIVEMRNRVAHTIPVEILPEDEHAMELMRLRFGSGGPERYTAVEIQKRLAELDAGLTDLLTLLQALATVRHTYLSDIMKT